MQIRKRCIYVDITMDMSSPGGWDACKLGNHDHQSYDSNSPSITSAGRGSLMIGLDEVTPKVSASMRSLPILVQSHHICDSLSSGLYLLLGILEILSCKYLCNNHTLDEMDILMED